MKAVVDNDGCTGCGLCVETCPEVFEMGGDVAVVKGDSIPAGAEDSAKQAADDCPSEAIAIQERLRGLVKKRWDRRRRAKTAAGDSACPNRSGWPTRRRAAHGWPDRREARFILGQDGPRFLEYTLILQSFGVATGTGYN